MNHCNYSAHCCSERGAFQIAMSDEPAAYPLPHNDYMRGEQLRITGDNSSFLS